MAGLPQPGDTIRVYQLGKPGGYSPGTLSDKELRESLGQRASGWGPPSLATAMAPTEGSPQATWEAIASLERSSMSWKITHLRPPESADTKDMNPSGKEETCSHRIDRASRASYSTWLVHSHATGKIG